MTKPLSNRLLIASLAGLFLALLPCRSRADGPVPAKEPDSRSKVIRFDDEVVEGMNKNPMDALENIADQDKDKSGHLYRKKTDFHREMQEQSTEEGYLP